MHTFDPTCTCKHCTHRNNVAQRFAAQRAQRDANMPSVAQRVAQYRAERAQRVAAILGR